MELTKENAREVYHKYLEEGLAMFPPFKGFGINLVKFAMNEPELYRLLFMDNEEMDYDTFISEIMECEKVIPAISESLDVNQQEAIILFKLMAIMVNGYVVMNQSGACNIDMQEMSTAMGAVCRGMLLHFKAPQDNRINMIPEVELIEQNHGSLEEYLKGKKNVIIGYGQGKEMYQIRLDAILYFEAVGENVFAYTRNNVYDIKQRLYQVEEQVGNFCFVRASKSLLVNTKKVASITPDTGGRGKISMVNGETVIASRSYYKTLLEQIKGSVD